MFKALKTPLFQIGIVALISAFAYWHTLGYFFTGRDIPSLISTSNVPLSQLLSTGLMGGQRFFRPLSSLSYALDYQFFGLNPAGWHFTNVLLHTTTAILTYIFVRIFFAEKSIYAFLAAIIFSIHPAVAQNVPDLSSRMDLLATLLSLASLTFIAYALKAGGGKTQSVSWGISVLAFLLATLSKEIAFVTIFVAGAYIFVFKEHGLLTRRFLGTLQGVLPYLTTAGVVFLWRTWILGDPLGRVVTNLSLNALVPWLKNIASYMVTYLWLLFFPQFPNPSDFEKSQLSGFIDSNKVLILGMLFLFIGLSYLWFASSEKWIARNRPNSKIVRPILFLVIWLLLILGVFLITLFRQRYMYPAIVPFAILLSIACVSGFEILIHRSIKDSVESTIPLNSPLLLSSLPILVLAQLFYFSPLLHRYDAWEKNGRMAQEFIAGLNGIEPGSTVLVENLPDPRWSSNPVDPQPREIGNIWLPAYQRLFYRDQDIKWCIKSIVADTNYYQPFTMSKLPNGNSLLRYEADSNASRTDYSECCQQFSCR